MLTHVNYRSGAMHDMAAITEAAHAEGALMLWDLAHCAGAVPVDLTAAHADFAVGCGYKYLNGGPGAPAFVWVAPRHQERFAAAVGLARPCRAVRLPARLPPGAGHRPVCCGTPPVLSLAALEIGVDTLLTAQPAALREKSLRLTEIFIAAVEQEARGTALRCCRRANAERRGSQVSFRHAQGWPVMQALIARGIIGDFRSPDILRFGFAPLYTRFVDAWDAAAALAEILRAGGWDRPEFHRRALVT